MWQITRILEVNKLKFEAEHATQRVHVFFYVAEQIRLYI